MAQLIWRITPEQMIARWFIPAFEAVIQELITAFDDAMDDEIWQWDRATIRSRGNRVTSPRSITDTGELKRSLVVVKVADLSARLIYQASYAALVLLGGVSRADGSVTPARDWISEGLSNVNLAELYAQEIRSRMR
jgi:hypothetical protein